MRLTVLNVSYPLAPVSAGTAGGAEQVLSTLDAALVQHGCRSLVIAPEGSKCQGLLLPTALVPQVLDEDAKHRARERHRDAIRRAIDTFPVDVVHLHGVDFMHYLPQPGVPVIVTLHLPPGFYDHQAFGTSRPETYLVCVSQSQACKCPPNADITSVIGNGVPLNWFRPTGAFRKGSYVLYMGRMCPEKAPHLAMDAARSAGVPCWIAGNVFPYPTHLRYFDEFIEPRLASYGHHFVGSVGGMRKRDLIAGAKCLLVPSQIAETSSLAAMEAFACGAPVIAFRTGALSEVVRHGATGFVVENVEEMADAILELKKIAPADCRTEAERRFSSETMVRRYFELYQQASQAAVSAIQRMELQPAA